MNPKGLTLRVSHLKHPHVVHLQLRGEGGVEADDAAQRAPDRQVQDDEEGLIEDPFPIAHVGAVSVKYSAPS